MTLNEKLFRGGPLDGQVVPVKEGRVVFRTLHYSPFHDGAARMAYYVIDGSHMEYVGTRALDEAQLYELSSYEPESRLMFESLLASLRLASSQHEVEQVCSIASVMGASKNDVEAAERLAAASRRWWINEES